MRINPIILFLFVFSFCSCFDDKGNYTYHEVADITIENIPEVVEVLGNSDNSGKLLLVPYTKDFGIITRF